MQKSKINEVTWDDIRRACLKKLGRKVPAPPPPDKSPELISHIDPLSSSLEQTTAEERVRFFTLLKKRFADDFAAADLPDYALPQDTRLLNPVRFSKKKTAVPKP